MAGAGINGVTSIWDTSTWKLLFNLEGHEPLTGIYEVHWSPDGAQILTAAGNDDVGAPDNTARIWDAATGRQLLVLCGHTSQVSSADWSPDGRRVVTASSDGTTRIWDAVSGAELLLLSTPANYFNYVSWSPDGQHLAAGSDQSGPVLWRVWQSKEELLAYAHECCVFRQLSNAERQQFGLPAGGE